MLNALEEFVLLKGIKTNQSMQTVKKSVFANIIKTSKNPNTKI